MRLCTLLGKQYIWQIKHNGSEINVRAFFAFLKKYLEVERYIAVCRGAMKKCLANYGNLINFVERE